jgi:hypothetical protein
MKIQRLTANQFPQSFLQQPQVPIRELVDFIGRNPMPSLRTKSISTKVTDEEYAQMEALAGGQTISEWARDVLLRVWISCSGSDGGPLLGVSFLRR